MEVDGETVSANGKSDSATNSFLVRIWREPRGGREAAEPLRGFVRNLRTGEEHYLGDPALLLDQLAPGAEEEEEPREVRREADAG